MCHIEGCLNTSGGQWRLALIEDAGVSFTEVFLPLLGWMGSFAGLHLGLILNRDMLALNSDHHQNVTQKAVEQLTAEV